MQRSTSFENFISFHFLLVQVAGYLDAEEFVNVIKLLSTLRSMQSLVARQDLVNMIINQCQLEQGWNVSIKDILDIFGKLFFFPRVLIPID